VRIVSLLPSATEIVCALGLAEQLVGVTHSCEPPGALPVLTHTRVPCDAPSGEIDRFVREAARRGEPLYQLDEALLRSLAPDLVLTQALCAVCALPEDRVHAAAAALPGDLHVLSLSPHGLGAMLESVRAVAEAAGVASRGRELVSALRARVDAVAARSRAVARRPRVALLEWIDPPFACGHWSPELVRIAGGVEGLGREGEASRTLPWREVLAWQPEVVFVACCGFTLERSLGELCTLARLPGWAALPAVRSGRVHVADGRAHFSRPGPRLVDSLEMLAHALHPTLHPLPSGVPRAWCLGDA
jgi:iron complex transport system substrate-binding protein